MDLKYYAVWHVLITDSQKREHSLAKHTAQSDPEQGTTPIFLP